MDAGPRRAIAYIAGRAVSGQNASSVYDYDASAHFHFSGTVSASAANVFDNEINRHISGSFPSLYHYGTNRHIQLNLSSNGNFQGFDYASSQHFSGQVRGNAVSLYDYEDAQHHSYSL